MKKYIQHVSFWMIIILLLWLAVFLRDVGFATFLVFITVLVLWLGPTFSYQGRKIL